MKQITLVKDFFLGGRATFTLQNNTTGEYRTFKIVLSKPNPRYPKPSYFVKLLTGPDNTSSYQYLGKLFAEPGKVWRDGGLEEHVPAGHVELTRASTFTDDSVPVKGIRYLMGRLFGSGQIHDEMDVRHAGKCGRCGRTLTTPESLDRGIGPECWGKMGH